VIREKVLFTNQHETPIGLPRLFDDDIKPVQTIQLISTTRHNRIQSKQKANLPWYRGMAIVVIPLRILLLREKGGNRAKGQNNPDIAIMLHLCLSRI
jgi:hypothetical protein